MNSLSSAVRRFAYRIWRRQIRATLDRPDTFTLFGLDLVVTPGVLHPRHFASSQLMARHLMSLDLRDKAAADIGTGSGLLGLLAARGGAVVTASDINPAAVECAKANALRNGLGGRISVLASDVLDGLPADLQFDVMVTNPPFYPRSPENMPDHAFAAGVDNRFFTKLAEGLRGRMTRNGALLLIHSSDADFAPVSRMLRAQGMSERTVGEKKGFFETLTIKEFRAVAP